jgi:hypothetical protein
MSSIDLPALEIGNRNLGPSSYNRDIKTDNINE